ncbi:hypothetical protein JTE90_027011 [Oedothorax gibbosus]|uniref:Chitin-binding type-2 domain-containing protein n=1 Tax=Oedothorax gibbosus TaxID=931172 RepID=A0AAV6VA10_9ARAC|nr:hypothetical protein JTE90_027011 [Oedothorax gibbosus]
MCVMPIVSPQLWESGYEPICIVPHYFDYYLAPRSKIMSLLQVSLCCALLAVCYGFTCPDGEMIYHADVSTGCTVYHLCQNSEMTTLNCPTGQAFDHHTNQCAEASTVHCIETQPDHHHHHHHKRSLEEVHTVSIDKLKETTKEVFQNLRVLLKTTLQQTVPTVYDRLKTNYTPVFKGIYSDFEPVVRDKLLPRMEKFYVYAKRMSGKIFRKIQRSYELSNSTHLSVVSFADVMDELSRDMQPVLQLGRYFSARLSSPNRIKRSADGNEELFGDMEPALKRIFSSMTSTMSGNEDSLTSRVIMPIIFNMTGDEETKFNLKKVFWSTKTAFAPLIYEMLKIQTSPNVDGEVIRVPHELVNNAKNFFLTETKPIIKTIFEKHLQFILMTCSKNTDLLMDSLNRLEDSSRGRSGLLKDHIQRFVRKHMEVLKSSDSTHFTTYTITEIKKDLRPIGVTLLQIVVDYVGQLDSSFAKLLFNRQSSLVKALTGEDTYAVPSGKSYGDAEMSNLIRGARHI